MGDPAELHGFTWRIEWDFGISKPAVNFHDETTAKAVYDMLVKMWPETEARLLSRRIPPWSVVATNPRRQES